MNIETSSWNRPRSWGMMQKSTWKDSDGSPYSIGGEVGDPVLGLVSGRLSKWGDGSFHYRAHCVFHGKAIDASISTTDVKAFTHRALARWIWKHAIPAMRKHAMETI